MQMMVEVQGETLDQVEHHAETTAVDIEKGGSHIDRAIVIAKSTRAVRCVYTCNIELPLFAHLFL